MENVRPKIGIIGGGAMGTLFGFHLAEKAEVTILDRNEEVAERIAKRGLIVNDKKARHVKVAKRASELFDSSVLFLFVKAVDTLRALRPFASELNPSTPVVSLQNGIGNEDAIKTALGGAVPVVIGITTESSVAVKPGQVRSSSEGATIVGGAGASPATARAIAEMLTHSGLRASVVYDIRPHLWGKLVANAAIIAPSAILECTAGAILHDPNAAHLAEALAEEAAAVATALKVHLPFVNPWQYVTQVIGLAPNTQSSMSFDLAARHTTEIDHINGAIIAAGRRTGVPTPYNDAILRLIKAKETLQ